MTDQDIYELASIYRAAIQDAKAEGLFNRDISFSCFPKRCCGDTCYLLAAFLKDYGISTIYVWGDYGHQTHAWLVVNDSRIKQPTPRYVDVENKYMQLLRQYGNERNGPIVDTRYRARDLTNGLVIDITADQFGERPVYVGKRNSFYQKYRFREADVIHSLPGGRLSEIYRKISLFLPE